MAKRKEKQLTLSERWASESIEADEPLHVYKKDGSEELRYSDGTVKVIKKSKK